MGALTRPVMIAGLEMSYERLRRLVVFFFFVARVLVGPGLDLLSLDLAARDQGLSAVGAAYESREARLPWYANRTRPSPERA